MASISFPQISPLSVKAELLGLLASNGRSYWNNLSELITAKISRAEFEDRVAEWLNTPRLVTLHNSLLTALIYSASTPPDSESPDSPNWRLKSRSRLHTYERDRELRSLRRWAVDVGRSEREQIRNATGVATRAGGATRNRRREVVGTSRLRNEMRSERGVRLMKERGNPPGTHIPIPLCESTGLLPTQQNLFDRMSLIASQHDMTCSKTAVALLMASLDANLKHLSARAIDVSEPSIPRDGLFGARRADAIGRTVTGGALEAVLTLAPYEVPGSSASTLFLGDHGYRKPETMSDSGIEMEEYEGYVSMLIDNDSPEQVPITSINEKIEFQGLDVGITEAEELYQSLVPRGTNGVIATVVKENDYYTAANSASAGFEPSQIVTGMDREHQLPLDDEGFFPDGDQFPITIGSTTSAEQIIDVLTQRGCLDLTLAIDPARCSEFPIAGGGFCDMYRGTVATSGLKVVIKSLRLYDAPGREHEKSKILKVGRIDAKRRTPIDGGMRAASSKGTLLLVKAKSPKYPSIKGTRDVPGAYVHGLRVDGER